jgi:cell division protease FtsH
MKPNNTSDRKSLAGKRTLLIGLILLAVFLVALAVFFPRSEQPQTISLSEAAAGIAQGRVVRVEDNLASGEFFLYYEDGKKEKGVRDPRTSLLEQFSLLGVTGKQLSNIQFDILKGSSTFQNSPFSALLVVGLIGVPVYFILRISRGERWGGQKKFSQSNIPDVKFDDVAGLDENLNELKDIVTFLKEGNRYAELGAKMPRGILMVGDPGTGKTLAARAIAGEAGVPFFATSGSEFTEVFVGVGASRMRALFKKARAKAPCIIFIDEIDAVGRSRHRSESGAEMEQDQTLNQLLVEMDGFDISSGVVVLAATNRVDVLDSALTRPGRFDRRVYLHRPDVKGREDILRIHVRGKRLSSEVDLSIVAKSTPGLAGADLSNIVNEAAISAVRNGHTEIRPVDFEEAIEKVLAGGAQRKNSLMSDEEKQIVAYHEAGHAVVMHETKLSDPVHKITIIPRGLTGGYTMSLPEQDRMLLSRCRMLARITGLLGGRAAEEIFFQDITSGASNDLVVATQLAEEMVMRLGMERSTGLRVYPQGREAFFAPKGSQKTYENIDEAVNKILETCYADAKRIIELKQNQLVRISEELLEVETLDREKFLALMVGELPVVE